LTQLQQPSKTRPSGGFIVWRTQVPTTKEFQNVAIPKTHVKKLKELAHLDQRSMARELSWLIDEAYSQLIRKS
jgi:hypothetical protein